MVYQRIQRGRGLGGFLKPLFSLFRRAVPLVSKAVKSPLAKNIGREIAKAGLNVTADAISGNNVKDSVGKEVHIARKRVSSALKHASTTLKSSAPKKKHSSPKNTHVKKKSRTRKKGVKGGNLF